MYIILIKDIAIQAFRSLEILLHMMNNIPIVQTETWPTYTGLWVCTVSPKSRILKFNVLKCAKPKLHPSPLWLNFNREQQIFPGFQLGFLFYSCWVIVIANYEGRLKVKLVNTTKCPNLDRKIPSTCLVYLPKEVVTVAKSPTVPKKSAYARGKSTYLIYKACYCFIFGLVKKSFKAKTYDTIIYPWVRKVS